MLLDIFKRNICLFLVFLFFTLFSHNISASPIINTNDITTECDGGQKTTVFLNPTVSTNDNLLIDFTKLLNTNDEEISDPNEYPLLSSYVGTSQVKVKACDTDNNCEEEDVYINIEDTIPPHIQMQRTLFPKVECTHHEGTPVILPEPTIYDICYSDICTETHVDNCITLINDGLVVYPLGITQVRFIASDSSNNISTLDIDVNIEDTIPPSLFFNNSDITLANTENCTPKNATTDTGVWVYLPPPQALDTCTQADELIYTYTLTDISEQNDSSRVCLDEGIHTITWFVRDISGNESSSYYAC